MAMAMKSVKAVVLGDGAVGKTSLIITHKDGQFPTDYVPTVFDTYVSQVTVKYDGTSRSVDLKVWDTAGQDAYEEMRTLLYPDTDVFIIVCAVDNPDSFENAEKVWIREAMRHRPGTPVILVGSKSDLRYREETTRRLAAKGQRPVSYKEGTVLAKKIGAKDYIECSAKDGQNLSAVFAAAVFECFRKEGDKNENTCKSFSFSCLKGKERQESEDGPVEDGALLERLKDNLCPEDQEFFWNCLTGRLPESAKYLIREDKEKNRVDRILSSPEDPSIIFKIQEEEVAIEVMKTYTRESWKVKSANPGSQENLLHYFITKRFGKALAEFLGNDSVEEDVKQLCFSPDAFHKIPLMTILSQEMEESALKLWKFMEKFANKEDEANEMKQRLENAVNMRNENDESIFHMSSYNGQNELLMAICASHVLSQKYIQDGLIHQSKDGRTPLDLCIHEATVLKMLNGFENSTHKLAWNDLKGKNIFHHFSKKDFNLAVGHLIRILPPANVKEMILQRTSTNGNNVLMHSAINGSRKALELLLHFVSLFRLSQVDSTTTIDEILHHRNEYGNTLLSLVLQQQDVLQVAKIVLLSMENDFHSRGGREDELQCCFHKNLNSSVDVLRAIQEVEKSNKKGTIAIVRIWSQTFLKAFVIPVGMMAVDILFDVFLVQEYFYMDQDCLTAQWKSCHSILNETSFDPSCAPNTTELIESQDTLKIFCIPLKLDVKPRFMFSLGFIMWPLVYYLAEFLQSDVFENISQVCCNKIIDNNAMLQEMTRTWLGSRASLQQRLVRTSSACLSSIYHIVLWPLEMHRKKFLSEARFLTSSGGKERVKARLESENAAIASGRSRMIEVCSESSFQPLLQFYLFLPTLIVSFQNFGTDVSFDQSVSDLFSNISNLQFWSILTSCISLAWSFTFYQSAKKRGALDFGANPLGRLILLFSNTFQISSRLVAFALLAYSWGDGNFWQAFVFVLLHILVMAAFHFEAEDEESKGMAIFQSILNGISNLYVNNLMLPLPSKGKKRYQNKRSFKRQLIVDILLVVENLTIILLAGLLLNIDEVWPFLVFVPLAQLCGLLLKMVYYRFFHIWSSILTKADIDV